jgi:membrane protease subunit HflK
MPWSSDGDNGGSWKPGNPGPWGQGPSKQTPPDFNEWMRRIQDRLAKFSPGGGLHVGGILILVVIGVALWLLSGWYTVGPNEIGLNKVFGAYRGKTTPGLNYNWPFPIGAVSKLGVTDRNAINVGFTTRPDFTHTNASTQVDVAEESLMLTADENIADVKFVVIWQIDPTRPEDFAFNVANPRDTVKAVAESAMREVVGRTQIQRILTAERKNIEPAVQALMQGVLNDYKAGVLILQVQLQSVDPPDEVIAAFRDVTAAQQDQDRLRNVAEAYANKVVPEARGKAAAIIQEAEGYREQTVAEAKGQASRFDQVYAQYKKAPDVTRERMYLETMERVLGGANKVIVDTPAGQGVVPYLPLPDLGAAGKTATPGASQ